MSLAMAAGEAAVAVDVGLIVGLGRTPAAITDIAVGLVECGMALRRAARSRKERAALRRVGRVSLVMATDEAAVAVDMGLVVGLGRTPAAITAIAVGLVECGMALRRAARPRKECAALRWVGRMSLVMATGEAAVAIDVGLVVGFLVLSFFVLFFFVMLSPCFFL
jgi:hypothetical protein